MEFESCNAESIFLVRGVDVYEQGGVSEVDAFGSGVGDGGVERWSCMRLGGTKARANSLN